jgi:hypothetical protein
METKRMNPELLLQDLKNVWEVVKKITLSTGE